jgi:hypothetical protein
VIIRSRRARPTLVAAIAGFCAAVTLATPALAAPRLGDSPLAASVVVENWRGYSGPFHKTHDLNRIIAVSMPGATDGKAMKLQLDAHPGPGPRQGVEITSNHPAFQYGTFGSRMKTANCAGQKRPGVVTGVLTYSMDHSDRNHNQLPDNDEIDFEVLCGQPEVIWMSLWTDYDEITDTPRKISRAINLRTGEVIYNCYLMTWLGACEPLLAGENSPAAVRAVPGFNAATQFHSYTFDWQPDRVRFYATDRKGKQILLWDYQGPASRIPQKTSMFLQNVWYTPNWDPFNGSARNQPTAAVAAYLDSTTVPAYKAPAGTIGWGWRR